MVSPVPLVTDQSVSAQLCSDHWEKMRVQLVLLLEANQRILETGSVSTYHHPVKRELVKAFSVDC